MSLDGMFTELEEQVARWPPRIIRNTLGKVMVVNGKYSRKIVCCCGLWIDPGTGTNDVEIRGRILGHFKAPEHTSCILDEETLESFCIGYCDFQEKKTLETIFIDLDEVMGDSFFGRNTLEEIEAFWCSHCGMCYSITSNVKWKEGCTVELRVKVRALGAGVGRRQTPIPLRPSNTLTPSQKGMLCRHLKMFNLQNFVLFYQRSDSKMKPNEIEVMQARLQQLEKEGKRLLEENELYPQTTEEGRLKSFLGLSILKPQGIEELRALIRLETSQCDHMNLIRKISDDLAVAILGAIFTTHEINLKTITQSWSKDDQGVKTIKPITKKTMKVYQSLFLTPCIVALWNKNEKVRNCMTGLALADPLLCEKTTQAMRLQIIESLVLLIKNPNQTDNFLVKVVQALCMAREETENYVNTVHCYAREERRIDDDFEYDQAGSGLSFVIECEDGISYLPEEEDDEKEEEEEDKQGGDDDAGFKKKVKLMHEFHLKPNTQISSIMSASRYFQIGLIVARFSLQGPGALLGDFLDPFKRSFVLPYIFLGISTFRKINEGTLEGTKFLAVFDKDLGEFVIHTNFGKIAYSNLARGNQQGASQIQESISESMISKITKQNPLREKLMTLVENIFKKQAGIKPDWRFSIVKNELQLGGKGYVCFQEALELIFSGFEQQDEFISFFNDLKTSVLCWVPFQSDGCIRILDLVNLSFHAHDVQNGTLKPLPMLNIIQISIRSRKAQVTSPNHHLASQQLSILLILVFHVMAKFGGELAIKEARRRDIIGRCQKVDDNIISNIRENCFRLDHYNPQLDISYIDKWSEQAMTELDVRKILIPRNRDDGKRVELRTQEFLCNKRIKNGDFRTIMASYHDSIVEQVEMKLKMDPAVPSSLKEKKIVAVTDTCRNILGRVSTSGTFSRAGHSAETFNRHYRIGCWDSNMNPTQWAAANCMTSLKGYMFGETEFIELFNTIFHQERGRIGDSGPSLFRVRDGQEAEHSSSQDWSQASTLKLSPTEENVESREKKQSSSYGVIPFTMPQSPRGIDSNPSAQASHSQVISPSSGGIETQLSCQASLPFGHLQSPNGIDGQLSVQAGSPTVLYAQSPRGMDTQLSFETSPLSTTSSRGIKVEFPIGATSPFGLNGSSLVHEDVSELSSSSMLNRMITTTNDTSKLQLSLGDPFVPNMPGGKRQQFLHYCKEKLSRFEERREQSELIDWFFSGDKYLILRTGCNSGKTFLFLLFASFLSVGFVLFIVPSRSLKTNILKVCDEIKVKALELLSSDSTFELKNCCQFPHDIKVVVACPEAIESNYAFLREMANMKSLNGIVLDEAHSFVNIQCDFRPQFNQIALNLTRTLQDTRIVTMSGTLDFSMIELLKDRVYKNAPVKTIIARVNLTKSFTKFRVRHIQTGDEKLYNEEVVAQIQELTKKKNAKVLVVSPTIARNFKMLSSFKVGVTAKIRPENVKLLNGNSTVDEIQDVLDFLSKEEGTGVVFTTSMLNEGVHAYITDVICIDYMYSVVDFIQLMMRAGRFQPGTVTTYIYKKSFMSLEDKDNNVKNKIRGEYESEKIQGDLLNALHKITSVEGFFTVMDDLSICTILHLEWLLNRYYFKESEDACGVCDTCQTRSRNQQPTYSKMNQTSSNPSSQSSVQQAHKPAWIASNQVKGNDNFAPNFKSFQAVGRTASQLSTTSSTDKPSSYSSQRSSESPADLYSTSPFLSGAGATQNSITSTSSSSEAIGQVQLKEAEFAQICKMKQGFGETKCFLCGVTIVVTKGFCTSISCSALIKIRDQLKPECMYCFTKDHDTSGSWKSKSCAVIADNSMYCRCCFRKRAIAGSKECQCDIKKCFRSFRNLLLLVFYDKSKYSGLVARFSTIFRQEDTFVQFFKKCVFREFYHLGECLPFMDLVLLHYFS